MHREELIALARATAQRWMLDAVLICALIEQESGWNPWLNRYEPQFEFHEKYGLVVIREARVFVAQAKFTVSLPTEVKNRCTSFGLMQVLGQVARERGFLGPIVELADPSCGLEYGCKQFVHNLLQANQNVHDALLRYNGGGDPLYPSKVSARMEAYR